MDKKFQPGKNLKDFTKVAAISAVGMAGAHSLNIFDKPQNATEAVDPKKIELEKKSARLLELQKKQNTYDNQKEQKGESLTTEETEELRKLFIEINAPLAQQSQKETGILASIILAQAILEGKAGSSKLALEANNYFGVKHYKHCKKKFMNSNFECCMLQANDHPSDRFKRYESVLESFKDHASTLKNKRYKKCFECGDDYECWIREIVKAGYATDPQYPRKIISLIKSENLDLFDKIDNDVYHPTQKDFEKEKKHLL